MKEVVVILSVQEVVKDGREAVGGVVGLIVAAVVDDVRVVE